MIWATDCHTMITFEQPNHQNCGSTLSLSANSPLFRGAIGWYDWGRSGSETMALTWQYPYKIRVDSCPVNSTVCQARKIDPPICCLPLVIPHPTDTRTFLVYRVEGMRSKGLKGRERHREGRERGRGERAHPDLPQSYHPITPLNRGEFALRHRVDPQFW